MPKTIKRLEVTVTAPKAAVVYPIEDEDGSEYFAYEYQPHDFTIDYLDEVVLTTKVPLEQIAHEDGMWTFNKILMKMNEQMKRATLVPVKRWTWECQPK